jgi:pyridoxal phosphate enzyme (YggS family)
VDAPLRERLSDVRDRIAEAARAAGRDPSDLTTIVVTKFHPASLVRELHQLGVRDFGENRHQEAQAKVAELTDLDATWHFIGQLQSNKAKQVAAYADVIHSVDRVALAHALTGTGRRVLIQVNLTDDLGRGGVAPAELMSLAESVLVAGLDLVGLMAVAPLDVEPRAAFSRVRELSQQLCTLAPDASALSMGMSGDFPDAILEGATHLRIGTAITGNRPTKG